MNSVNLVGNLTRDPDVRYIPGVDPKAVCNFSIAINRPNSGVDYPRIVCFGKLAENCERYLKTGKKVAIEGRLQTDTYEKDGHKVFTTEVVASRVEFLSGNQSE